MNVNYAHNAIGLPERLFPDVDFDTNESRYYNTLNNIAITLVEYRYHHGLTQTALAQQLGVTQAMVSKYESGDYNISLKAAFELFEKLGIRFSCAIEQEKEKYLQPTMDTTLSEIHEDGSGSVPDRSSEAMFAA